MLSEFILKVLRGVEHAAAAVFQAVGQSAQLVQTAGDGRGETLVP